MKIRTGQAELCTLQMRGKEIEKYFLLAELLIF